MYYDDIALGLLALATLNGVIMFGMKLIEGRGREERTPAGLLALHAGLGLVAILVWFAFTTANGDPEMDDASWFTVSIIAGTVVVGALMVSTILKVRKEDALGDQTMESAMHLPQLGGHIVFGVAALVFAVIAAFQV